jgi:hypothetical protein
MGSEAVVGFTFQINVRLSRKRLRRMNMFSVSYDLLKPGQDYTALWARLRALGATRVLESQWALRGAYTATALRDDLVKYIDTNDRLLVIDVTNSQFAWHNLKADIKSALALV